jgi:hypothetical protein
LVDNALTSAILLFFPARRCAILAALRADGLGSSRRVGRGRRRLGGASQTGLSMIHRLRENDDRPAAEPHRDLGLLDPPYVTANARSSSQ